MNEFLLHYIWQYQKIKNQLLKTIDGKTIIIFSPGFYNTNEGTDFILSRIMIDKIEWIGNIEIHLKSSDWIKHKHELKTFYSNIIIHVVYEHDCDIPELLNNNIPTLELKQYISKSIINNYKNISRNYEFIPCEKFVSKYFKSEELDISEKLYVEKLEKKCEDIFKILKKLQNDWEATLAVMLSRAFGLEINSNIFERIFIHLDYKVIRKNSSKQFSIESLLFGISNSLNDIKKLNDEYGLHLKKEYEYLKNKYNIEEDLSIQLKYLRLRPYNFPTIRLSQLSNLISQYQGLFSYVIGIKNVEHYYRLLEDVKASEYWDNHYILGKQVEKSIPKKLSKYQKDKIILNTFITVKFAYSISISENIIQEILEILYDIPPEKNSIVHKFNDLGKEFKSALETQAYIYLYKEKCIKKQCLNCPIGYYIMK